MTTTVTTQHLSNYTKAVYFGQPTPTECGHSIMVNSMQFTAMQHNFPCKENCLRETFNVQLDFIVL